MSLLRLSQHRCRHQGCRDRHGGLTRCKHFDAIAQTGLTRSRPLPQRRRARPAQLQAPEQFLGGGTTLLDLMKLYVIRPKTLVHIKRVHGLDMIETGGDGLRLGALVTMAQAARDERLVRNYPMVVEALALAATTQIRDMARLGGTVLQRTRCNFFRHVTFHKCNKRSPGDGCAALDGHTRKHAIVD